MAKKDPNTKASENQEVPEIQETQPNQEISSEGATSDENNKDDSIFAPKTQGKKPVMLSIKATRYDVKEIKLKDLIPFRSHSSQTYHGQRLEQLMSSIERLGLMNPIIVRPVDGGKYEIICGHNRVEAVKTLGHDMIRSEIRTEITDDEAIGLFYDSNLNQQTFSDWSYSQKIDAIKYSEKLIKENSQQGKRTDLEKQNEEKSEEGTSVYSGQKLDKNSKRNTTRDKMARRLGIATATLSKYRSIIKLPDDMIDTLARMLDSKRLTFEAAYRISKLRQGEAKTLLKLLEKTLDIKADVAKLKVLIDASKSSETVLTEKSIRSILLSTDSQ